MPCAIYAWWNDPFTKSNLKLYIYKFNITVLNIVLIDKTSNNNINSGSGQMYNPCHVYIYMYIYIFNAVVHIINTINNSHDYRTSLAGGISK